MRDKERRLSNPRFISQIMRRFPALAGRQACHKGGRNSSVGHPWLPRRQARLQEAELRRRKQDELRHSDVTHACFLCHREH